MTESTRAITVHVSSIISWGLILILGQLLVTQWTVKAAGNRDIIDYVSFAGTVVGMILAILAIVYSYLSNAQQKNDSASLRVQIANLNEAVGRAQASERSLANELERLGELRDSIATATATTTAALEASTRVEAAIGELRQSSLREKESISEHAPAQFNENMVAKFFIERALIRQLVYYYLAVMADHGRGTPDADDEAKFRDNIIEILSRGSNASANRIRGEIDGYYWIFFDLDVVGDSDFLAALKSRADEISEDAIARESAEIVEALKNVTRRIGSHL